MVNRKISYFFCLLMLIFRADGQDLFAERIRKVAHDKRAVFLDNGIFHNGPSNVASDLKGFRHHYSRELGYERLVFDFSTETVPRIYAYMNGVENKLYIDFFKTQARERPVASKNSHFIRELSVFQVEKDHASLVIAFKQNVGVEMFYLDQPGRFVIDIKDR